MRPPPPWWPVAAILVGVIVGLLVAAAAVMLVRGGDGAPRDVVMSEAGAPTATPVPAITPTPAASPTPAPSASPSAVPTPSASPQGDAPLRDLATLVPPRVGRFTRVGSRPAPGLLAGPRVEEALRVRYRRDDGTEVLHLVSLHRNAAAAGRALRQRRAQALDRRGARVVDDTGLEDTDGVRRGRLLQVRARSGDIIVLWRNRNLVGRLGPGRARLQRRLYDAWPY